MTTARIKLTDACSQSGVKYKTLYRWVVSGLIPGAEFNTMFNRWTIPADWVKPVVKMGAPRKVQEETK